MLQLITEILGEKIVLDLYGDEEILASISIAEVQDISQKNSSFTQDFNLPGSKINNQVFQHFYNVNSVQTNYDARNKFSAYFTYDGYTIMTGYIRLNSVVQTRTEIVYNVNFYNQIGDVASNISDKYMRDLDLSYLSHPYNEQLGYDSIPDPDLANSGYIPQPTSGITYWSLFSKGYQYQVTSGGTQLATIEPTITPLLQFSQQNSSDAGTFSNEDSPVRYFYFTPTIKINELYRQVFLQSGYDIDSDFFDTAYFNRFHLPLSFSDTLYPLQSFQPEYGFSASTPAFSGRTQFFCQNDTCTVATAGSPPQDFLLPPSTVFLDNFSANTGNNYSFQLTEPGLYHFRANFTAVNTGLTSGTVVMYIMRQFSSATSFTGLSMQNNAYTIPGSTTGDSVTFDFNINTANKGTSLTDFYSINTFFSNTASLKISGLTFQLIPEDNNPRYITGDFDYNLEFPENEFKQIDFIQSINKMFNLVVVPNTEFPSKIRVEPVIDYFHSGEVLDWTSKVDRNSPILVQPTTTFLQGTISYQFPDEEDTANTNFRELNNRNFGTQNITLNTDYKDSIINIQPVFSALVDYVIPTPLSTQFPTLPIHYLSVQKDVEGTSTNFFSPYETNPQLFYRGIIIPSTNFGSFSGTPSEVVWRIDDPSGTTPSLIVKSFPNNHRFTTYPFGVSGFSHYINFNKTDFFDIREKQYCGTSDMYDIYWKDYILDLTDDESRMVSLYVYLTPFEIQQLDFSELILIDGNYYRINKIADYSLSRPNVVLVELIKKTRDYTSHPVRYFDLDSCTGSTIIHTSTDYNATIYAYVGNYIKVGGTCYEVVESTYNSSYTYQRVNNDYYYSEDTLQPVVFQSCSDCTGATSNVYFTVSTPLDIYDELPC